MKKQRKKILIDPRLQWRFIVSFTCLACAAVMFEAIILNRMLIGLTDRLPDGGEALLAELNGILFGGMTYTLLLLVPVAVTLGMVATFRVAGPLYAIRRYLHRVASGEEIGECHIRESDELHNLCSAVNEAVSALRSETAAARPRDGEGSGEPTSIRLAS